jgi:class 3 adenylate cyclase/tetratricopeptide (TPR) repeat protein
MSREANSDAAERRQLTVLFCDLVGSTALAEQMDPEDLRTLLRDYQQRCAAVVRRHGGHIAQYLGDGLMVYFGYPAADEEAPRRAVESALGVVQAMSEASHSEELPHRLGVRIGVHTGPVVVGEMGDPMRPERLAVGTTPNLAARVQAEASPNTVLLSQATHALVAEYFECEFVGTRTLRGVSRPVGLHRVVGAGPVSTRLGASERRGFSPLAGRDQELTLLLDRWDASRSEGKAVVVVGEPGVGKSRLAFELGRAVRGCEVVQLVASEHAEAEPFHPLVAFLERWAGFAPADPVARRRAALAAALERVGESSALSDIAVLLSVDAVTAASGMPSPRRHAELVARLAGLFRALARAKPMLLVVEDAQWLDASTRDFLTAWLAPGARVPALTVATSRTGADLSWASAAGFEQLPLGPLSRQDARAVAEDVARRLGAHPPDELLERALDRAEGVPLFVEELTRGLADQELGGPPPSSLVPVRKSDPVPASLQDSLMARLDRLGSAKPIAQLAAVVGRDVPLDWLDALSPVGADVLDGELGRLVASGLLIDRRDEGERTYSFSHALLQEAAYQSLVKADREELHQRVAEMLASSRADVAKSQPLVLAHHYLAAGRSEKAVGYLFDAGRRMLARSAFPEAIEVLRRALSIIPAIRASAARDALEVEVLSALGLAYLTTRGYAANEVEEVYSKARQICESSGDVPLRVLYGVWGVYLVRADLRGIRRLAERWERIIETTSDRDAQLIAHSCLAVRACYGTDFERARVHARAAWDLVDLSDPKAQYERLLGVHGFPDVLSGPIWVSMAEMWSGSEREARQAMEAAATIADRIGDPQLRCTVAIYAAYLHCTLQRVDDAREYTSRALALSTEHGFLFWQAIALCEQGWLTLQAGNAQEAAALIQQGLSILDAVGSVINRTGFACLLLQAQLEGGMLAEGLKEAEAALGLCREAGALMEPEVLRLKGEMLLKSAPGEKAVECLRSALSNSRLQGNVRSEIRAAMSLGRFLAGAGRVGEARDVLTESCQKWPEAEHDADADLRRAREVLAGLPA